MATILDGKAVAAALREELKAEASRLAEQLGRKPSLVTVQVGDDEASTVYANRIAKTMSGLGIDCRNDALSASLTPAEYQDHLRSLGGNLLIDALLPLLPLPAPLSQEDLTAALAPEKDVDGIHPQNAGKLFLGERAFVPNTPAGGWKSCAATTYRSKGSERSSWGGATSWGSRRPSSSSRSTRP